MRNNRLKSKHNPEAKPKKGQTDTKVKRMKISDHQKMNKAALHVSSAPGKNTQTKTKQ